MKIKPFLANLRYTCFAIRFNREIFNRIFPHALCEADHGYPFNSREELRKAAEGMKPADSAFVRDIDRDIARMPEGLGEAFRYVFYRDMKSCGGRMSEQRMRMYRMFARENIQPEACDPKYIARRAPQAA